MRGFFLTHKSSLTFNWPPPPTQSPTLLDYGEVLLSLLPLEKRTAHLFSYICELSLLNSALTKLPLSKLACAALLLTRALHRYGNEPRGAGYGRPWWYSSWLDELLKVPASLLLRSSSLAKPAGWRHKLLQTRPRLPRCAALRQVVWPFFPFPPVFHPVWMQAIDRF